MTTDPAYLAFLAKKAVLSPPAGIDAPAIINPRLFPFQDAVTRWALKRGSALVGAGTGMGKTGIQLAYANAIREHTQGSVLILAPLAVGHQTAEDEAPQWGISDIAYTKTQAEITSSIVVTNYERVEEFDPAKFVAVVCDESSIIKSHDSKTRATLMEMFSRTPYKLCCTATPAPNDYVELGQHAEFLGVMTQKEMLATFFVHDGSIRATNVQNKNSKPVAEWRLKRHAEADFWRWLASWAVIFRHPSDLGFDQPGYDLPPLNIEQITVSTEHDVASTGQLFAFQASTLQERLQAKRGSIHQRAHAAAALINQAPDESWLIWCHLNDEADALRALVPSIVEVRGPDHPDLKTKNLIGFARGLIRHMLSKVSIAGFGLNLQKCNRMIFLGLNDSYEQLYQAIRRCWRFGQKRPVTVYLIASDREGNVVANLRDKEAQAEAMMEAMLVHMRELTRTAIRTGRASEASYNPTQKMEIPRWLTPAA